MLHAYNTAERSDVTPWGPSIVPFKATIPAAAALLLFQGRLGALQEHLRDGGEQAAP